MRRGGRVDPGVPRKPLFSPAELQALKEEWQRRMARREVARARAALAAADVFKEGDV